MYNKVFLLGRLGKDPETFYTQQGSKVVKLNLATTEYYNQQEHTEWHNVVMFGKVADNCAQYLQKGSLVFIEGKLHTRKWQDNQGNNRYITEIIAQNVKFLTPKNQTGTNEQETPQEDDAPF